MHVTSCVWLIAYLVVAEAVEGAAGQLGGLETQRQAFAFLAFGQEALAVVRPEACSAWEAEVCSTWEAEACLEAEAYSVLEPEALLVAAAWRTHPWLAPVQVVQVYQAFRRELLALLLIESSVEMMQPQA